MKCIPSAVLTKCFLAFLFLVFNQQAKGCSAYKLTAAGKTIVGTNEDTWRTDSKIWFETGREGEISACFTGSRKIGTNAYAAQSGMNSYGLTYTRLTAYHPVQNLLGATSKKPIKNPDQFLKLILHQCKDVASVYAYLEQYDRSVFIEDVFLFVEPSGKYLIVEPYTLTLGDSSSYVISNFCPSITPESQRRQLKRYRAGVDFLKQGSDTTAAFCTNLSKQMHVSRDKLGDGTLLTAHWDTKQLTVKLFFYHDYTQSASFNLSDELAKGDHQIDVPSLFETNTAFNALKIYLTPFSSEGFRIILTLVGLFFLYAAIQMSYSFWSKPKQPHRWLKIATAILCLLSFVQMYVLVTNQEIFFFKAPFQHYSSTWISVFSYLPFLLLLCIIPITLSSLKIWRKRLWTRASTFHLLTYNSIWVVLIGFFQYWKFYDVF